MTHVERLKRSPSTFRLLTGITPQKFDALLGQLLPGHEASEAKRLGRPGRRRKPGAGRKFALGLGDRLLMLLIYYRTYATHALLGFLFAVDPSSVCRNINPLQPLLAGVFRVPEKKVDLDDQDIRELFFDATERPARRPKRGQRAYYSGKKKRHTIKTQVVVVARRKKPGPHPGGAPRPRRLRVAAVSPAFPGRTHDKNAYDRTRVVSPAGVPRAGDTAYQGTTLRRPHKKPRKGTLTARQKKHNRRLSTRRVVAEHAIGKMKVWRAFSERYRNPFRKHTMIVKNVAGLHNLMFA